MPVRSASKPVLHASDHLPGGCDPINFSAISSVGGAGGVTFDIAQAAHGFAVGDVIRYEPNNTLGTPAFVASASTDASATAGSSITATIPAGLAAGHVLILKVDWENDFGDTSQTASATGFTRLTGASADNYGTEILYRVLNGTEAYITSGGTVTVGMAGLDPTHNRLVCLAAGYSGCSTTSPFNSPVVVGNVSVTTSGYTATYTTTVANEMILQMIAVHPAGGAAVTSPASSVSRQNATDAHGDYESCIFESPLIVSPGAQTCSVTWTNHEFQGVIVSLRPHGAGNVYVKAKADTATDAEVIGIVTAVADANHFTLMLYGHIAGLSGLTVGTVYFLSPTTAGALTATEPSATGQVSKPLLIADGAGSGFFFNMRGKIIGSSSDSGSSFGSGTAGGGGLTKLFDSRLTVDAASIDTGAGSIPAGYSGIEIHIIAKSSGASAANINVQFNGDTAANYDREYIESNGSSIITGTNSAATSAQVASTTIASATYPGVNVIFIPAYADTTFNKALYSLLGAFSTMDVRCGGWRSTAAISQVKIAPSDGSNFKAGSRMIIYGLP